jgi:phosphoribosylformimino-5-aminoimidazole carboxamide ribonucleotide (ProFAR) isomerase
MMSGPNLGLLADVLAATSVPVIQSGGVSNLSDLSAIDRLSGRKAEGAIIGRAIYEGAISLRESVMMFTKSRSGPGTL